MLKSWIHSVGTRNLHGITRGGYEFAENVRVRFMHPC